MTASEFRWPSSGSVVTIDGVQKWRARSRVPSEEPERTIIDFLLVELATRDTQLAETTTAWASAADDRDKANESLGRVRALADRWAADNQPVWADELRKVLEGS